MVLSRPVWGVSSLARGENGRRDGSWSDLRGVGWTRAGCTYTIMNDIQIKVLQLLQSWWNILSTCTADSFCSLDNSSRDAFLSVLLWSPNRDIYYGSAAESPQRSTAQGTKEPAPRVICRDMTGILDVGLCEPEVLNRKWCVMSTREFQVFSITDIGDRNSCCILHSLQWYIVNFARCQSDRHVIRRLDCPRLPFAVLVEVCSWFRRGPLYHFWDLRGLHGYLSINLPKPLLNAILQRSRVQPESWTSFNLGRFWTLHHILTHTSDPKPQWFNRCHSRICQLS